MSPISHSTNAFHIYTENEQQGGKCQWHVLVQECIPCHRGNLLPSARCDCCWCHGLQTAVAAPLQNRSPLWTAWRRQDLYRFESLPSCQPVKSKRGHMSGFSFHQWWTIMSSSNTLCSFIRTDSWDCGHGQSCLYCQQQLPFLCWVDHKHKIRPPPLASPFQPVFSRITGKYTIE